MRRLSKQSISIDTVMFCDGNKHHCVGVVTDSEGNDAEFPIAVFGCHPRDHREGNGIEWHEHPENFGVNRAAVEDSLSLYMRMTTGPSLFGASNDNDSDPPEPESDAAAEADAGAEE